MSSTLVYSDEGGSRFLCSFGTLVPDHKMAHYSNLHCNLLQHKYNISQCIIVTVTMSRIFCTASTVTDMQSHTELKLMCNTDESREYGFILGNKKLVRSRRMYALLF